MKTKGCLVLLTLMIHLLASCDSELTLAGKGSSDYRIVVPAYASKSELKAASYLQRFVDQSVHVKIPIIRDREPVKGPEISIGYTNRVYPEIKSTAENLSSDGFLIKTSESNVYVLGGSDKAVVYGVSSFLERFVGIQVLSSEVTVVPDLKRLKIPADLDWVYHPPFEFRSIHYRDTWKAFYADWHKLHHLPNGGHPGWGWWVHTFDQLVPPDNYFADHPEYYAEINDHRMPTQLCLTNPEVLQLTIDQLRKVIDAQPELAYWSVSQNDNVNYCRCENCQTLDKKHGGPMGSLLTFVNSVADSFPDRVISTLAYQYSRTPPIDLVPRENVNIMLCTIELDRSEPIATADAAAGFREDLEVWGKLTDDILIWDYVVQFENLVSPFPNIHVLQPNLIYFLDNQAKKHFQQGNREVGGEFAEMRAFLIAKLLWNPYADLDSLTDIFLEGYYGKAAKHLKKYIRRMQKELIDSGSRLDIFGHPFQARETYLRADLLTLYEQWFDRAEAAVSNDPDYLKRVRFARMPLQYAQIEIALRLGTAPGGMYEKDKNGSWVVREDVKELARQLVLRANEQGVTRFKEWHTIPNEYLAGLEWSWQVDAQPHLAMDKEVTLENLASTKYADGNADLLTDGFRGPPLTYTYNWLGFEGNECMASVDLGEPQTIRLVSSNWLQDSRSWIFLPLSVDYYGSDDGENWTFLGAAAPSRADQTTGTHVKEFRLSLNKPVTVRFVKMNTSSRINCPDWHPGSGGPAWIFTDELIVK